MQAMDGQITDLPVSSEASPPQPLNGMEVLFCNTSSLQYRWMNFSILVAKVHLFVGQGGVDRVVYRVFRVT